MRGITVACLRAIAEGEPDTKLGPTLNALVPTLVGLGLLQVCGHSDGDYVVLTDKGWDILKAANP